MVSLGFASIVLAALTGSAIAIEKGLAAIESYATAEGDQMRFADYIAMDVRRCISASVANGVMINGKSTDNVLILTIPDYYSSYDSSGNPYPYPATSPAPSPYSVANNPSLTNGAISYGTTARTIRYYQQGSSFYREVGGVPSAIAINVAGFSVSQQDLTTNVKCTITFTPRFNFTPLSTSINGTSVYTTTFLRNAVARQ